MGIDAAVTELLPGTDKREVRAGRVTLRRFARADLDQRCAWPTYDDVLFDHLNLHLDTPEKRDGWFEREWVSRSPFWFAVEDENGELVGTITLREVGRWRRSARLGIHLHPQHLGQGYGTEVMKLFLDYYFNMLGYALLKLDVAACNKRAIRCYEKVGFKFQFEFYQVNTSGLRWLEDERFAHVRDCVKVHHGLEKIRHYEMHIDAATHRSMQERGG